MLVVAGLMTGNTGAHADTADQILAKIANRQQALVVPPSTPVVVTQQTTTTYTIPKGTCIKWGTVYRTSGIESPCIKYSKSDKKVTTIQIEYTGTSQFENQLNKGAKK